MFGLGWKDVLSGVATGVGFAFGGPVGGALVGGVVGGAIAGFEGKGWEDVMEAALVNGALGAIPGGMVGGAAKGALLKGGAKALGQSFKNVGTVFINSSTRGMYSGVRMTALKAPMKNMGLGTLTAAAATAYGGKAWREYDQPSAGTVGELPVKIIN
ncbi:hypothetical protein ACQP2U_30370 [Nocardia sp. CA-084685]|uniref:hypothetical protein n=1 Tax=Nocardia sp. CA-084685 TaxID=3239970 RepID=UPI003D98D286